MNGLYMKKYVSGIEGRRCVYKHDSGKLKIQCNIPCYSIMRIIEHFVWHKNGLLVVI